MQPKIEIVTDRVDDRDQREALRRAADVLARILDTAIAIPGTTIRIGVDPLLGLLPGAGDAVASFLGSTMLVMAAQLRVPKIVLARMSANILINGVVGVIPVLGDLFSVWFRSNARNAELLRRHSSPSARASTLGDWAFLIGLVLGTLAVTLGAMLALLWLIARLWEIVN